LAAPKGKTHVTKKQKVFIESYLQHWNGVQAARDAGYALPEKQAYQIINNPIVHAEIQRRVEKLTTETDDITARLLQQARLNPAMFYTFEWVEQYDLLGNPFLDENGEIIKEYKMTGINWEMFEKHGHLIKSLRYSRDGRPILEFHNVQAALLAMWQYKNETNKSVEEVKEFSLPAEVIAPSFLNVYRDIRNQLHTEYVFSGGRGSTKSSFISLIIPWLIVNNPTLHAAAFRQVGNTLRDSVYAQIQWAISELGLSDKFKCTTSPLEIEYIPTGQKIYFRGADDPGKIKSIKPPFGHIGIVWFEELDQFKGQEAIRKIEQSVIRGGDDAYIFKSFNPPQTLNNWANKYLKIPKDTQYQHFSTYEDVPIEWLGKTFIEEAEHLKSVNPKAYEHEYLGIANSAGGLVFENVELREITDAEIYGVKDQYDIVVGGFDRIYHGLDWGYYPDPAHYSKVHYDAARHILYIYGEVRRWKAGNRELYDALVDYGLLPSDDLICDSAEPKSVADFRDYGSSARGAEKGPESVNYSMKWLQSLRKIVIDPVRCPYSADEFISYEFEVTKDGEIINAYPDKNNHGIDSVRYATNRIWKRRGQ
jgi:PBSX family phage terminase large subunit